MLGKDPAFFDHPCPMFFVLLAAMGLEGSQPCRVRRLIQWKTKPQVAKHSVALGDHAVGTGLKLKPTSHKNSW